MITRIMRKIRKVQVLKFKLSEKKLSFEDIEKNKKKTKEVEKQKKKTQKSYDVLLTEAKERLSTVINKDDKKDIQVA